MKAFFKKHFPYIVLSLVALLILVTNYKLGTYLTGWDNLQTELNPWLGVKRSFFAVWQEYQSLGLLGGMGHASDIVRSLFIWFISWILPQSVVRYFFHILMLLLGGLGMYKLLSTASFRNKYVPLLGAIFYMLNFGTVQIFYVPFEAFSVFFAALPWEIWIFTQTFKTLNKRNLLLFFLINLIATPQAYVQTLFVVYILFLSLYALGLLIKERTFAKARLTAFLFLIILFINSFWILPQIYFLKTSADVVRQSKINQLATNDLYYQNYEKGTLRSFLKMQGFYYDLFRTNGQFLFLEWRNHFQKPVISLLPYFFMGIALLGIFKRGRLQIPFCLMFALSAFTLLNATPPFSWLNSLIRENGLIGQVFRSPFTKFIIPYALVVSYFFASGIDLILERSRGKGKSILLGLIALFILVYSLPAFSGYFFSPSMKVKIPQEYLELMDVFKTVDKGKRIALLPDYTFWGWFFHRWGYNGSGFLWYGIEQPIISRTFDVWSDKSEGYFWEMKAAAEAEDVYAFEKILEKYDVDYLVLDLSLLPVSGSLKSLQYERIANTLAKSRKAILIKNWKDIRLYKVKHDKKIQNFTSLAFALPNVGPNVRVTNKDVAYLELGDYQINSNLPFYAYYPFMNLTTQVQMKNRNWTIEEDKDNFVIKSKLPINPAGYNLSSSSTSEEIAIYKEGLVQEKQDISATQILSDKVIVTLPKKQIASIVPTNTKVNNCGPVKGRIENKNNDLFLTNQAIGGAIACFGYDVPFLEQRYGYLIVLDNKHVSGRRLFFYILDKTKRQSYIEERLRSDKEFFLLSPKFKYGLGYNFVFQNNSYENLSSENALRKLDVYLFPYDSVQNIVLTKKDQTLSNARFSNSFNSEKKHYFFYQVQIDPGKDKNLILYQAFHPGWKAYQNGKELKDHVLVNNWANGWRIEGDGDIKIVFWPQYLEFIGFGLLIISFLVVLYTRRKLL